MTDKVQKIREEVERLQNELIQEKEKGFGSDVDDASILELQNVLTYIDSLQEEPCNSCQGFNDKDKCDELVFTHNCPIVKNPVSIWHDASEMPDKEKKILTIGYNDETYVSYFNGVNPRLIKQWAYIDVLLNLTTKEEPVSEEFSTTMIRKAARHFANWQKENLWKPADGDDLPEIDREVIALTQPYPNDEYLRVVFAHRPNKYTKIWNSDLGEEQVVEIERHDKGGWNIPDVKWWLDCSLPNMEED